jgi:hypothetical protein
MTQQIFVFKSGASTGMTMGLLDGAINEPPESLYSDLSDSDDDEAGSEDEERDAKQWWEEEEGEESEEEDDEHGDGDVEMMSPSTNAWEGVHWIGKVKWISPDHPFAAPGDSGDFVYVHHAGIMTPLGIHISSAYAYESSSSESS